MEKEEYLKLVYSGKQKTNEMVFVNSFKATTWSVGIYFAVTAYLFQWDVESMFYKVLFCALIVFFEIFIVRFILYCKGVHEKNAIVICKIDEESGAFEKGRLIKDTSLYPEQWRNYGKKFKIKYYVRGMIIPSVLSAFVCILIIILK